MSQTWDAIIVGARCAGSPTAMLLARKGYRVLLVDRASFPSDTVSTHVVQPLGVAALARWGLLDRLVATGCPPIHTYALDFGPITIAGSPGTKDFPVAYCPRRTVLDHLLVSAAAESGVEVRERFTVEEVLFEDGHVVGIKGHGQGGESAVERARIVIGADGQRSLVARAVQAEQYHEKAPVLVGYYTYWSGLPTNGRFETFIRPRRGFAAVETHDGLALVIAGWPYAEFEKNKKDIEGNYLRTLEMEPTFAERLRGARREARFAGAGLPGFFRKPYGPGWALVGDAGHTKDPITAQGIKDAFQDAERCAAALDDAFSGRRAFEDAMAEAQRARDEANLPMYELTFQIATLEPPPPETQALLATIHGHQPSMDAFIRVNAGTTSPAEFFAPENLAKVTAAARGAGDNGPRQGEGDLASP